jgi:hypothetical protein
MMNTETEEKNPHLRTKFTTEREETVQNMKKMINERLGREEDLVAYNIYRGCIRSRHLASTEIGDIEQKNELTIFTPREKEKEGSIEVRFFRKYKRKKKEEITHFEEINPRLIGVDKKDTFFYIKQRVF